MGQLLILSPFCRWEGKSLQEIKHLRRCTLLLRGSWGQACSGSDQKAEILSLLFYFFLFLAAPATHMEVPRSGTESELQLQPMLQLQQHQIL